MRRRNSAGGSTWPELSSRSWDAMGGERSIGARVSMKWFGTRTGFKSARPRKHKLYRDIESAAPHVSILASSTSALTWSDLTLALAPPCRLVTAHPFNPAHLMPLIELCGRVEESVETAVDFFSSMGKQTVRLKRDAVGHIANRLASALWREAE